MHAKVYAVIEPTYDECYCMLFNCSFLQGANILLTDDGEVKLGRHSFLSCVSVPQLFCEITVFLIVSQAPRVIFYTFNGSFIFMIGWLNS
jgi:hypothetical protein